MAQTTRRVKWRDIGHIVDSLLKTINDSDNQYDCIISVNRGGLVIGTCLSYKLNLPHGVVSINYKENYGRAVDMEMAPEVQMNMGESISISQDLKKFRKVLLFDDSCDTGYLMTHTVNYVKTQMPDAKIDVAVVFLQKQSDFMPTYYYEKMDGKQLFVFDWENP